MNLCVIPARGGSKRIPRKNIKEFCGKPMIAYAVEVARASGLFTQVIVSTDDSEIAAIAKNFGAEIPFVRPPELADDYTATAPVISHAINASESLGCSVDNVCCMYPAAPFIQIDDLTEALFLMEKTNAKFSFPVAEFPSAIQRALRRDQNGLLSPFQPEHELTRTQDLELVYHDVGQFYWGSREAWLDNTRIHSNGAGLIIPGWRVVDIDTPQDWYRAELIYEAFRQRTEGSQIL
jgi:pseudaminic acid cytidylyltransferase